MTEREHSDDFLSELLQEADVTPTPAPRARVYGQPSSQPALSRREERKLLKEANMAGPVTLMSDDESASQGAASSFGSDAAEIMRRYPLPTLLGAVAVGYLLGSHRRRR